MGMDPELVQSLPRDMIEELLQNNQMWADNLGNPPPNQAQPAEAEMGIADMIAATGDPNLRREMLIQLSNDQAATLPEALRAERRQLVEGLNHPMGAARMNQMNHIRDRMRDRERGADRDRPPYGGGYGSLDNIFGRMRGEVDLDRILGQRVERVKDAMQ